MEYKVLYRKYRPSNFDELVGQDNIKEILVNSIKSNKIAHAYIFTGPRGTGKTSTAKIFAKTLNCLNNTNGLSCDKCEQCISFNESPDIIEIDAASNNGVDEIRQLRDSVSVAPYCSKYKIYIIDEVHMLSNSAWNALLKTLEEPPKHVIFILATTEINKVPITVLSRCQRFDFNTINKDDMFFKLKSICDNENILISEDALYSIIKISDGCLRDALSYLDKLSKFDVLIENELIEKTFGIVSSSKYLELTNYLIESDINNILSLINDIEVNGFSAISFINEYMNFLLDLLVNKDYIEYKTNIYSLINDLNDLIFKINTLVDPYIILKSLLLGKNYFPGNKKIVESDNKIMNKDELNKKNINSENDVLKNENKSTYNNIIKNSNINKKARINNSFVEASKTLKNDFNLDYKKFVKVLMDQCDYKLLGYLKNISINVVSKENVLFSFENDNEVTLFNNNIEELETAFYKIIKKKYKFYSISFNEWNIIKSDYLKNKNKYCYIDEEKTVSKQKNTSDCEILANNLFGSDIINIG